METSLLPSSWTSAAYTLCFNIFLWKMRGRRHCITYMAIIGFISLFLPGGKIGDPRGHTVLKLDKCIKMYHDVDKENGKAFLKVFGVTENNTVLLQVDAEYNEFIKAAVKYTKELKHYHYVYRKNGGIPYAIWEKFRKLAIENKGPKELAEWSESLRKAHAELPSIIREICSEQMAVLEELLSRENDILFMAHLMTWNGLTLFIPFYDYSENNSQEFNITAMEEVRDLFQEMYILEQQYMDTENSWIYNYMPGLDLILNRGIQALENDEYFKELKYKLIPEAKKKHEKSLKQYIPWLKHNMYKVDVHYDWINKTEIEVLLALEERENVITEIISTVKAMISEIASYPVVQVDSLKKRLKSNAEDSLEFCSLSIL